MNGGTIEHDIETGSAVGSQSVASSVPNRSKVFSVFKLLTGKGLGGSKFNGWTRYELVMALVAEGFEVRNEDTVPVLSLVDECARIFKDREMPSKSRKLDGYVKFRMNYCAGKIQNAWWAYQVRHNVHGRSFSRGLSLKDIEQSHMETQYGAQEGEDDVGHVEAECEGIDALLDELEQVDSTDTTADAEVAVGVLSDAQKAEAVKLLNQLNQSYRLPSWEKARRSQDFLHPRKGGKGGVKFQVRSTTTGRHCTLGGCGEQCDLWGEGMVSEFGIYGSGVTNYFKFLKWVTWVFFVLALITLPEIFLNIYGVRYKQSINSIAQTTIGNLANVFANITVSVVTVPGCQVSLFGDSACTLSRTKVGWFYGVIDVAACVFLLCAFVWLRIYERMEEVTVDKNTIYAAMYTIQVKNLPSNCTDLLLSSHFNTILGGQFPIVSVQIAHRSAHQIKQCARRGDLLRLKNRLIIECRYQCTQAKYQLKDEDEKTKTLLSKKISNYKLDALRKIRKVDEDIKRFDDALKSLALNADEPLVAFVTFEDSIAAEICIDLYKPVLFDRWYFDKRLLFENTRLQIERAPEPSVVIWENLEYSAWNRFCRKCVTLAAALVILAISLGITVSSKTFENEISTAGGSDLCPFNFYGLSNSEQLAAVAANKEILHCYCENYGVFTENARRGICKNYFKQILRSQVFVIFASMVVVLMGGLIEYFIRKFVDFEKHHSEDEKQSSIFLRLFFLQYVNASVIFLVNNSKFLAKHVFQQASTYQQDFSAAWYSNTGAEIVLVQLGNVLLSQSTTIYEYFVYHATLKATEKTPTLALTQSELNKAHLGPEFEISYRYAMIMSTIFVCMTFSTGMPILYGICGVTFYLYCVCDKYAFIKLYRNPHRFSSRIGNQATLLIPLGVALHMYASAWVLSDDQIFSQALSSDAKHLPVVGSSTYENIVNRINLKQTFPLFFLGSCILGLYVAYYVIRYSISLFHMTKRLLSGDEESRKRIQQLKVSYEHGMAIPFTRAVQRNLIKGLASYNLLQNPRYKERFAITWNFAFQHRDLRSVLYEVSAQSNPDDDDDIARVDKLVRLEAKDKEILANLSRSTEHGVLGTTIRNKGSFETASNNNNNDVPSVDTPQLSARGGSSPRMESPRPGSSQINTRARLQKYSSTMHRQQLLLDDMNTHNDDLDLPDPTTTQSKLSRLKSLKANQFDEDEDLQLYMQANKTAIRTTSSNEMIKIGTYPSHDSIKPSSGRGTPTEMSDNKSRSTGTNKIERTASKEKARGSENGSPSILETSPRISSGSGIEGNVRPTMSRSNSAGRLALNQSPPDINTNEKSFSKTSTFKQVRGDTEHVATDIPAAKADLTDVQPVLRSLPTKKKQQQHNEATTTTTLIPIPTPSSDHRDSNESTLEMKSKSISVSSKPISTTTRVSVPSSDHNTKATSAGLYKPVVPMLNLATTVAQNESKPGFTVAAPASAPSPASVAKLNVTPLSQDLSRETRNPTAPLISSFAYTQASRAPAVNDQNRLVFSKHQQIDDNLSMSGQQQQQQPVSMNGGMHGSRVNATVMPPPPDKSSSGTYQAPRVSRPAYHNNIATQNHRGVPTYSSTDYFVPAPNSLGNYSQVPEVVSNASRPVPPVGSSNHHSHHSSHPRSYQAPLTNSSGSRSGSQDNSHIPSHSTATATAAAAHVPVVHRTPQRSASKFRTPFDAPIADTAGEEKSNMRHPQRQNSLSQHRIKKNGSSEATKMVTTETTRQAPVQARQLPDVNQLNSDFSFEF